MNTYLYRARFRSSVNFITSASKIIFVFSALLVATIVLRSSNAAPVNYRFISLDSQQQPIGAFSRSFPAINDSGDTVWHRGNFGFQELVVSDGLNTDLIATPGSNAVFGQQPHVNNAGQVILSANSPNGVARRLRRYESDGSFVEVANGIFGCAAGEYCGFSTVSINDSGEVATNATFNDNGTPVFTVSKFDGNNNTEIARQGSASGDVVNFGAPSINNTGAVVFGAKQIDNPGSHVFSGNGGPLNYEGTASGSGSPYNAIWNNNGLILAFNTSVDLLQGGALIETIIDASSSTGTLTSPQRISINDLGDVAIVSRSNFTCNFASQWGVFTGGNEIDDVVVHTSDALFGGIVNTCGPNGSPIRMGRDAINIHGEIVFLIETVTDGNLVSHVARAIPLSPLYDSEDDGVTNEVDNCLIQSNPDQADADGDGIGTACDSDFNQDCFVNFLDLGEFADAIFSTEAVYDLNSDGVVNFLDLSIFAEHFLLAPGPSALGNACVD